MPECTNPAMKDLLPELLGERRGNDAARAHVATCESCARDLALLREVRSVAVTPRLDTARIVAGIPSYRSTVTPWRRMWSAPVLRIAAVLLLVAGSATLLSRPIGIAGRDTAVTRVATQETARGVPVVPGTAGSARISASELAVGDPLNDLSESDLRALLSEMQGIEAVTSTETDVIVLPAVGRSGE